MAAPSGPPLTPIVRNSFLPESWSKDIAGENGVTVLVLGLIGAVFLYALYKAVSGSSKSHQGSNPAVERRGEAASVEKVGCIVRISNDILSSLGTQNVKVAIEGPAGKTLSVRHVSIEKDSHANLFCLFPKNENLQLKIDPLPSSPKPKARQTEKPIQFKVSASGLYVINQDSQMVFTPLREGAYPKPWTPTSSGSQDNLVPTKFTISSNDVQRETINANKSLIIDNKTQNYQVVDITFAAKNDSSEIEPLSFVVEAGQVKTLTFEQIFKDWAEAYTLKNDKYFPPSSCRAFNFKINKLTATAYYPGAPKNTAL